MREAPVKNDLMRSPSSLYPRNYYQIKISISEFSRVDRQQICGEHDRGLNWVPEKSMRLGQSPFPVVGSMIMRSLSK